MDLRRLRAGEWITALAGGALIASLWLPWWSVPAVAQLERTVGDEQQSQRLVGLDLERADLIAWEVLSAIDVLLLALGIVAVGVLVLTAIARTPGPGLIADALLAPAALVLAIVTLVRVLDVPGALGPPADVDPPPGVELGPATEYGGWVALAACLAILAGALLAMRDERLSRPGRPTDQTGAPLAQPLEVETLPGPPAA
jgi:hypothetical protein